MEERGPGAMQGISLTQEALNTHGARALRLLETYWRSLPVQGTLAPWTEVDPGAIQDALEYAFMAVRVGRRHARIRVAGGAVGGPLGTPLTGLSLSALIQPEARPGFDADIADCFQRRCGLDLTLRAERQSLGFPISARLVLYPLGNGPEDVSHFLGGFVVTGPTGPAPCRFNVMARQYITRPKPRSRFLHTGHCHLRLVVSNQ